MKYIFKTSSCHSSYYNLLVSFSPNNVMANGTALRKNQKSKNNSSSNLMIDTDFKFYHQRFEIHISTTIFIAKKFTFRVES